MKVLSPVGDSKYAQAKDELSLRVGHFDHKVIGIIDDGAGKVYIDRIRQLFQESYQGVQIIQRLKPFLSAPSPASLIDEVASASDAAIVGTGV